MARAKKLSGNRNQESQISALVPALLDWFEKNARDLPWRRTTDPYAIWVSEIMLQQTQVKTVLGYWERWMHALPTVESLAKAKSATVHKLWEGLGYYTRVRNMQKAAQEIMAQHGGEFPRGYDAILELPGIGRYTAGAIASIAFDEPRPILDGNVMRVLARIFGIEGNVREKTVNERLWKIAEELVGEADLTANESQPGGNRRISGQVRDSLPRLLRNGQNHCSHLNQSLMELGALICTPKQPKCPVCPARTFCNALQFGRIEKLPNLGKRVTSTPRQFVAYVLEHRGRYLVRQRPAGVVNAHLWEFPNVEVDVDSTDSNPPMDVNNNRRVRARGLQGALTVSKLCRPGPPTGRKRNHALDLASPRRLSSAVAGPGLNPQRLEHLCTIKHTITRYRITLEVYRGEANASAAKLVDGGRWLTPAELRKLAFTSAHRRILERLKTT